MADCAGAGTGGVAKAVILHAADVPAACGAAQGIIGVGAQAHACFVHQAGERIGPAGVFIQVAALGGVAVHHAGEPLRGVVAEVDGFGIWRGDAGDIALWVVGKAHRPPKSVGHRRQLARSVVGQGHGPAVALGDALKLLGVGGKKPLRLVTCPQKGVALGRFDELIFAVVAHPGAGGIAATEGDAGAIAQAHRTALHPRAAHHGAQLGAEVVAPVVAQGGAGNACAAVGTGDA